MVILSNHEGYASKSAVKDVVPVSKNIVKKNKSPAHFRCGCSHSIKGIPKAKLTGKVTYIPEAELDKLNPYLRSEAGQSILNLSAYGNKLKVYFATSSAADTSYLNAWIESLEPPFPKTESLDWDDDAKIIVQSGLLLHSNFLNVEIEFVETYQAADYIVYLAANLNGDYGLATFPVQIDTNPNLNGKLSFAIGASATYGQSIPPQIGNLFYYTIIHEIGHTFGLAHPFDNGNGTTIMPGCSGFNLNYDSRFYNQGLLYTNNTLTSIMSYVQPSPYSYISDGEIVWNTNLVQTLMSLDLQSYKYLYKVTNNQKYIDNFIDLSCPSSLVQTLISTKDGITLDLVQAEQNILFNLSLERYQVNPMQDNNNSWSVISSSVDGYFNFPDYPVESQTVNYFGASILDKDSFIKQVNTDYSFFNVFARTIQYNCLIKGTSTEPQSITIWLKCRASDYIIKQTNTKTTIQNKINKNILTVEINEVSQVLVKFANNEPLPAKKKKNNGKGKK